MTAVLYPAPAAAASPAGGDERSLLIRIELLLEREKELLESRDAEGLFALAQERERLTASLGEAAQARRRTTQTHAADEAELIALYERLRHRHDVRARVMRRHAERNACAVGVLAQAANQPCLYGADGRVPAQRAAA